MNDRHKNQKMKRKLFGQSYRYGDYWGRRWDRRQADLEDFYCHFETPKPKFARWLAIGILTAIALPILGGVIFALAV